METSLAEDVKKPTRTLSPDSFFFMSPYRSFTTSGCFRRFSQPAVGGDALNGEFQQQMAAAFAEARAAGIRKPVMVGAIPFDTCQPSELYIPERWEAFSRPEKQRSARYAAPLEAMEVVERREIPEQDAFLAMVERAAALTALVYTAAAHSANIWTPESAQGQMLEQLGFSLATLPGGLPASHSQGKRHDIVQLGGENLAAGLNGQSLFLFAGDQKDADAIYANPLLAHLPAVAGKRVYPLGTETFRLDYYSALLVLQRLSSLFG